MASITTTTKMDPSLKAFLRGGMQDGIKTALRKSLMESRRHNIKESTSAIKKSGMVARSLLARDIKKLTYTDPAKQPATQRMDLKTGMGCQYTMSYSTYGLRLSLIPHKTKRKYIKTKNGKRAVMQVYTNVYNRGFKLENGVFWLGQSPYKKPSPKDKALAFARKGASRKPLNYITGPSISQIVDKTILSYNIVTEGSQYLEERFSANIGYLINNIK